MKFIPRLATFIAIALMSGCGGGGGADASGSLTFSVVTVVPEASFPVSLAQSRDGRLFYTELATGNIRVVENGALNPKPVASIGVLGEGNEGLLGLVLDPDFSENNFLYTYYTAQHPARNRVVRFAVAENSASDPFVLIDNLPFGGHNGGRLAFGRDKTLFVSVGDSGQPALAQSPHSMAGKILRINRDGSIPSDNPDPSSPIFASGLRNAFGLAVDPRTGALYASDNGPNCDDELNRVEPGSNLGWRENQPCGDSDTRYSQPLIRLNPPIAPTGISFYSAKGRPHDLLLTDYLTGHLTRFEIDEHSGTILNSEALLEGELGQLIDVHSASDGSIYVASTSAISRLVPH